MLKLLPIPESIYKHLYFEDVFEVRFQNYRFLIKHYGFQLENELFWKGIDQAWEKVSTRLWIELSKQAEVILDIGANTGIYSLVAKSVQPHAKVFAFEPVSRVYEKLCANIQLNQFDVTCFELAVSDTNGEAIIYDTPTAHVYSVAVNKNISGLENTIPTKIKTQKLATFIEQQQLTKIDLIKIDVETHEAEVLRGMENYLATFKPSLLIEVLNDEVGAEIEKLVKDLDYLYFSIDELSEAKQVKTIVKSAYYNYLICSPDMAKRLHLIS